LDAVALIEDVLEVVVPEHPVIVEHTVVHASVPPVDTAQEAKQEETAEALHIVDVVDVIVGVAEHAVIVEQIEVQLWVAVPETTHEFVHCETVDALQDDEELEEDEVSEEVDEDVVEEVVEVVELFFSGSSGKDS
jgi:hypothetical protein